MFPFKKNNLPCQSGGKGENMLHVFRNIGLKGHSNQSQERAGDNNSIICYVKCVEDLRPKGVEHRARPEHVSVVGWRLPAPVT